ncbi:MAG: zinc ribbon domain-containing protein [Chloroflexi bacterium]|nr:zinc ribbon domain-containing protein [Chloroflexota bacterium]
MKNFWKWILGITLVLVLFFGPYLFQLAFPTLGFGYGMMVGRADHFGMMGGRGFSFFGAGLMWLVPLGTLALIVLGVVWLVSKTKTSAPASTTLVCDACGEPIQADWKACPHCGTSR